jgi:hypothetical protein
MKNTVFYTALAFAIFSIIIISCKKEKNVIQVSNSITAARLNNVEPKPSFTTPYYPVAAIYIIYKEFEKAHPTINTYSEVINHPDYDNYLKERLDQLYPELASTNDIAKAKMEVSNYTQEYVNWLASNNEEYTAPVPPTSLPNLSYYEQQLDGLSQEEIAIIDILDSKANPLNPISKADLNSLLSSGQFKKSRGPWLIAGVITAGVGVFLAVQIITSKNRATTSANLHFPSSQGDGEVGDAFRHICVSMYLRKYCSQPMASIVMWSWEQWRVVNGGNPCKDMEMDLHNNKIGRDTKYSTFRNTGTNSWQQHAINIKNFVNNSANRSLNPTLIGSSPTTSWKDGFQMAYNCSLFSSTESTINNTIFIQYQ